MRIAVCFFAVVVAAGCGASRPARHFATSPRDTTGGAGRASLSSFINQTREASARATARAPQYLGATLESIDPALGAAVAVAAIERSPAAYRRVAAAYAGHGVFDRAHEYLGTALRIDRTDAATYDALARLWRDARLPHLALGDAYRAVYFAPQWAVAHNTLGTVLQALGHRAQARGHYERALEIDPAAAYALNNLCYASILDGQQRQAMAACEQALSLEPDLRAARNNLALAQAATGDLVSARRSFEAAADAAGAAYNVGIVNMARRDFTSAVASFDAAQLLRPAFPRAAARARQARGQSASGGVPQ
ncbi:MAG: tetratricopeptide repeat protein [Vicinamibacterales bacterium]